MSLRMVFTSPFVTIDFANTHECRYLISDGPNECIQAITETGIARRMVELLLHTSFSVRTPALRMLVTLLLVTTSKLKSL